NENLEKLPNRRCQSCRGTRGAEQTERQNHFRIWRVKATEASRTALLIAASLILLRHDPKYSRAIPQTSADLCARLLKTYSARTRLFLKITRWSWVRAIAKVIERSTIPGILLHYALRKKNISQRARAALIYGSKQLVVIGAGFDPLSLELHGEFRPGTF